MRAQLISTANESGIPPSGDAVSQEPLKIFLGPAGGARIVCPGCARARHINVPDGYLNKRIELKCNCKQRFPVIFDKRSFYRKKVSLTGEYWNSHSKKDYMRITSISKAGIGFETTHKPSLVVGEIIRVRFMLDDSRRTWIDEKVEVKRVDGCVVGAQFSRLGDHEQKAIGFYLM